MQLSLSRFIVILSFLVSVVRTEYKEEYTKGKAAIDDSIDRMALDESPQPEVQGHREKRRASRIRNGRTTYVKAILSNPKLSPGQQMAQKLARAELESPKMQQTFKKLTAVHAARQNSRQISGSRETPLAFARSPKTLGNSREPPRFKGPRKRKRKRHKSRRRDGARGINSNRRETNDYHLRLARQTGNSSSKTRGKNRQNRYGKSAPYYPNESSKMFNNNQNFDEDPGANLDLESLDTSQQSSAIDENSSKYLPNYPPLSDQNDNLGNLYSPAEANQDFLTSNDQSPNQFVPSDYNNLREKNLDANDHNFEIGEHRNSLLQPKQSGDPNSYQIPNNQYSMSDGFNSQRLYLPQHYRNNQHIVPNNFDPRNNFRNYGDLKSDRLSNSASPLYPSYRSGSFNPSNAQRLVENSGFLSSRMNSNLNRENNFLKSVPNTLTGVSTLGRGEYMKPQARRAPRIEKSEQSMEKSVSGTNETCTTTEMNPKLKGIGEASAVPSEIVEKTAAQSKSLKGTEYHLLPMNANEPQAAMGKSLEIQRINSTSVANETKEVAGQILNKIIEELEDLKLDRTKNNQKEGLPCRLSGSWITTLAGVRIDMLVTNRTVNVSMAKLDLPVGIARQGILNYTWNITGYAPFKRGGPFSLTATDNHTKSLALFVGACRVCQGVDTIEGVWSIAREPRDCRDFQVATSIYNDIFRRTKLLSAIKERQLEMTSTTKCTSTTTIPTTKEDNIPAALGVNKSA